jgi:hypothetical protein
LSLAGVPCAFGDQLPKQHAEITESAGSTSRPGGAGTFGCCHVAGREPLRNDLLYFASEAFASGGKPIRTCGRWRGLFVMSVAQFDRLMSERAVVPHFSPSSG